MALRIVVVGAGGQLGQALVRELRKTGHEVAALTRAALDVTQRLVVLDRVTKLKPEVVVNATVLGVDASEDDPKAALAVNAFAVRSLADVARAANAALVHFSSDYVFDGIGDGALSRDGQAESRERLRRDEAARRALRAERGARVRHPRRGALRDARTARARSTR